MSMITMDSLENVKLYAEANFVRKFLDNNRVKSFKYEDHQYSINDLQELEIEDIIGEIIVSINKSNYIIFNKICDFSPKYSALKMAEQVVNTFGTITVKMISSNSDTAEICFNIDFLDKMKQDFNISETIRFLRLIYEFPELVTFDGYTYELSYDTRKKKK